MVDWHISGGRTSMKNEKPHNRRGERRGQLEARQKKAKEHSETKSEEQHSEARIGNSTQDEERRENTDQRRAEARKGKHGTEVRRSARRWRQQERRNGISHRSLPKSKLQVLRWRAQGTEIYTGVNDPRAKPRLKCTLQPQQCCSGKLCLLVVFFLSCLCV